MGGVDGVGGGYGVVPRGVEPDGVVVHPVING